MRKTTACISFLCAGLLLGGCVTETTKKKTLSETTVRNNPQDAASGEKFASNDIAQHKDVGKSDALDACAEQLHELSGLLLEYYAVYHHLPAKLEDLLPLADAGKAPSLVCPVSHDQYIYNPNGPMLSGAGKIVVYDAKPVHGGLRWGIAVAPAHDQQPLECKIIKVPEAALK